MFSKYFQSELTYLRELGLEFAEANPSLAGLFAQRGGDPDVERLLEGFAFLTARIRERIDDAIPEVIEALAQLVIPQAVRPIPACSIVEFLPHHHSKRGVQRIAAGAELGSREVEGTTCLFRTTADVILHPLELECEAHTQSATRPQIRLSFRRAGAGPWHADGDGIRLFLHGAYGVASVVFLWMTRHLRAAHVVGANGARVALGPRAVRPLGASPELPLLSWPELAPDGLRVLQEYFSLPSKMLFLELRGFSALPPDILEEDFDVELEFDRPPSLPERVPPDLFRLHCVPVINLFNVGADPIRCDPARHEHLVRAEGINPRHMEVYAVNQVEGLVTAQRRRRTYSPWHQFSHLERESEKVFYTLRRTPSPIDGAFDTYLSVTLPGTELLTRDEVLSTKLVCTNRHLPDELRTGDICESTSRSPTAAAFRNLTSVSKPARAPVGDEMHWRLVSHLALNAQSLGSAASLRALLHHYNAPLGFDHQLGRANEMRIEAIREVRMNAQRRMMDGASVAGVQTQIVLDESAFASTGDAFLFGSALEHLLVSETPLNAYHQLRVTLHPSSQEFLWTPRTGTQAIL